MKLPDELVERAADWLRRVGLAGVVTDENIEGGFFAMAEAVLEAALSEGGEVVGVGERFGGSAANHSIQVSKPGRYLVIPLDSKE